MSIPPVITLFLLLFVTIMPYGVVMAPTFSQLPVLLSYFWSVVYILRRKLNRDYDDFNHDDGVFVVPITLPTPSSALAASRQPPPNYSTAVLYPHRTTRSSKSRSRSPTEVPADWVYYKAASVKADVTWPKL